MTEIEVPLEQIQEDISHAAHHASKETSQFMNRAAVMSAFLAVAAAITALFAGHFANEAMIEQIQSTDRWAHYQAKGIKANLAEFRNEMSPSEAAATKIEGYRKDQEEIKAEAEHKESESRVLLKKHETLAAAVMFFQVAIALIAISVLTRKKMFMLVSLTLGILGVCWSVTGFLL